MDTNENADSTSSTLNTSIENGYVGLSDDYEPFDRQVAGHKLKLHVDRLDPTDEWYEYKLRKQSSSVSSDGQTVKSIGVLRHIDSGHILKHSQGYPRGDCEIEFFENLFAQREAVDAATTDDENHAGDRIVITQDPLLRRLADLVPLFYGRHTVSMFDTDHEFLEMEDITARFTQPCILDVKIGIVTSAPNAVAEKKEYEAHKYPLGRQVGFRMLGMQTVTHDGTLFEHDKNCSKTMVEADIIPTFEKYLGEHRSTAYRRRVMGEFITRLHEISDFINDQRVYKFISSSILFVFEGDETAVSSTTSTSLTDARMIDFTHVFDAELEHDANYAVGLTNFIKYAKLVEEKLTKSISKESSCEKAI